MEESTRLHDPAHQQHRGGQQEFGDDQCSTDSGCSSGGSTGSAEIISRRGSGERLCSAGRSSRSHCYLNRLRGRSTTTQERLSRKFSNVEENLNKMKSSRSWSPDVAKFRLTVKSPSHSQNTSDAQSSDSDSSKKSSTARSFCKAFQSLKISTRPDSAENKCAKKNPKRILRSPVAYTYVKGLSGLPTKRVPRNAV